MKKIRPRALWLIVVGWWFYLDESLNWSFKEYIWSENYNKCAEVVSFEVAKHAKENRLFDLPSRVDYTAVMESSKGFDKWIIMWDLYSQDNWNKASYESLVTIDKDCNYQVESVKISNLDKIKLNN